MDEYCYYRFQKWDTLLQWNPALGEFEKRTIKKKPRIYKIGPITPQGRVNNDYERGTVQQGKYILLFDSLPYTIYGRISLRRIIGHWMSVLDSLTISLRRQKRLD